ncbi:MAG: tryptophan synthase subunit alpha, partial [Actinomycetota bacterium]|nr:tryptophan synthase subunit alpha [Actinomycetota bacterium]
MTARDRPGVRATLEDRRRGGRALVCYLPAGYPDLDTSVACLHAAAEAGADLLEIGFPFSDPIMDGPTIQAACQHALGRGYRVDDFLDVARRVTAVTPAPALVMTYFTIAAVRGLAPFARDCAAAGLSGAILPDLPAGESGPWLAAAQDAGLETVFLAASVSSDARLAAISAASTGFVYATGLLGVTGVDAVRRSTRDLVSRIRQHTALPVLVGVGVSTPEQARDVAGYADGVIVGSALVRAAGDGDP